MSDDPQDFIIPHIRRFEYDAMRQYVRDCADAMRLRDWTCGYAHGPLNAAGQEAEAQIEITYERLTFTLWLPPRWYGKAQSEDMAEVEEARTTVAHELLHVKFVRMQQLHKMVQTNLGESAWGVYDSFHEQEMENFIDDLAEVVAGALPLPRIPSAMPPQRKIKGPRGTMRPQTV